MVTSQKKRVKRASANVNVAEHSWRGRPAFVRMAAVESPVEGEEGGAFRIFPFFISKEGRWRESPEERRRRRKGGELDR